MVLNFLYKTMIGRLFLKVLNRKTTANLVAVFLNSRFSKYRIKPFIKKNNIDMSVYVTKKYTSYNDFFTRKMKTISFSKNSDDLITPASSAISVYKLDDKSVFSIKDSYYSVESLLKNRDLASKYTGGYAVICRMAENDFHRYIYIDDGRHKDNHYINGVLHTVQSVALEHYDIYKENSRSYTKLHTKNFGLVTQIEVGAMMIGRISNFHSNYNFKKGEEKGMFEFGGSTIVLLIEKDKVFFRKDILANSKKNIETQVFIGDVIGSKNKRIKKGK